MLQAIPEIDGVTLRVHGESGIPEGSYGFWETVLAGIAGCGRRVQLDLHSKGIDDQMIDLALATGQPVDVSPKFWAEHLGLPYHQAEIRALEQPGPPSATHGALMALSTGSRRFTRYGYADLLRQDRRYDVLYRVWPGTHRLLLWGDPVTGRGYAHAFAFGGARGVELFEPLAFSGRRGSGRPGAATPTPTPICAPPPATGSSTPTPTACGGACSTTPGPARSSGAPPWRRSWAGRGQPRPRTPWPAPAASCPW